MSIHNDVMSASSITTEVPVASVSVSASAAPLEDGSADDSSNGRRLRRRKYIKEYPEAEAENGHRSETRGMRRVRYRDTSEDEECEASGVVVSTSMRGRLRKLRKFT